MYYNKPVVPFKLKDLYHGLAESEGLIISDKENLIFEFQTKDNIIGVIKSDVKIVKIPLKDINSIAIKKNIFYTKLIITFANLTSTKNLPGGAQRELTLNIEKKNRDECIHFVSQVNVLLAEQKLRDIEKNQYE